MINKIVLINSFKSFLLALLITFFPNYVWEDGLLFFFVIWILLNQIEIDNLIEIERRKHGRKIKVRPNRRKD